MNLLIPVDSNNRYESLLTTLDSSNDWAFVELDAGQIVSCTFYKDRKDIDCWVETVVVINDQEYVWQFMEEGIAVLVAPTQRSIDEIVEAFLFKELHDLNV